MGRHVRGRRHRVRRGDRPARGLFVLLPRGSRDRSWVVAHGPARAPRRAGGDAMQLEQRMALEFRSDLFAHCVRLSQAFHDYRNLGDFIYRINFEAHHVGAVTVAIPALIQSALTLVAMFVITYAISPTLALLALSV